MAKLLYFVPKNAAILREVLPEETNFEDINLNAVIDDMCYSILPEQLKKAKACHTSAAGMAANQWGIKKRIFIFTPDGSSQENKLEVMINPSYVPYLRAGEKEFKMAAAYEGCFSIPLTVGLINRYEAIQAIYYNVKGQKIERLMEGWEARVFQHETDHLDGKLFDGRLDQYQGPPILDRVIFKNEAELAGWLAEERSKQKK